MAFYRCGEAKMARKVKSRDLGTRAERERLAARGKPYWRRIEQGLHLGYRRLTGRAGTWIARHYVGDEKYNEEIIGLADDRNDAFAGGATDARHKKLIATTPADAILSYDQAVVKAQSRKETRTHEAAGSSGPLTVRETVERYLEAADMKSKDDARSRANAFIYEKLGDIECGALTSKTLAAWHQALAKEPPRVRTKQGKRQKHRDFDRHDLDAVRARQATANRTLTVLKAALNKAFNDGDLSDDKAWRRVKPFKGADRARVRYLEIEEAKRLVRAIDPEFRPIVQAALQTGMRYSELARLLVRDFSRDAGTVSVHTSKSGKARHIVLTDEGTTLFKQLAAGRFGQELLLPRADGGAFGKSHQARPMKEACRAAKIRPLISFHGLRHTWASHAVMNGVPLLVVAQNLGHSDTRMVERHYGHLAPSFIADAIRKGAPRFGIEPSNVTAIR
jgi:integrase